MNLTAVLLTGLLAGGVSCAAVQGGLLAALIARQRRVATPVGAPVPVGGPPPAPARHRGGGLGDDLVPVGSFLAGKLISHTLLGGLLGALGATVRLSVHLSAALQILAGTIILVFGLAQLGVPGLRRIVVAPPASFGKLVLRSARSQAAFAPGLLGLASILIPCGVTLSVEALALTSGSATAGAATMAVFVLGTSPLFAVLGYAVRKAATAWRGRLAVATAIALLVMGLLTLNGGLELADSPLAASRVLAALSSTAPTNSGPPRAAATVTNGHQTVRIEATSDGYSPTSTLARAGIPTTLIVHSDGAQGCIRTFTVPDLNVQQVLPTSGDTRIDLGALPTGTLSYACAMGMYNGTITAN